jgi:glycosyltransferase involved in cell wall biosynthesis
MTKLSIVIPARNEEARIPRTLGRYAEFFKDKKTKKELEDFEILVIINKSSDKTVEVVKEFSKKYKEVKYFEFEQQGKGFAITEGFKKALQGDSNLIGFIDADMSTPPNAFYGLVRNIKNYDGIIANRWDRRSRIKKQTLIRRFVSRMYNIIVRTLFLFPYRDTQCGAKLFKREVIAKGINKMISSKWNYDVALLFCLKKEAHAKIIEIPTDWDDEKGSAVNLKRTPIQMLLSAIRLRFIHSPFNFIIRFYRKLPENWQIHTRI